MQRLLPILLVIALVLSGCGAVDFRGGINFGHISGTVSIVSLTITSDHGSDIVVTIVTLSQSGSATTMNFCGDQRSQFPLDTFVRADFNPGSPCSNVISVSFH